MRFLVAGASGYIGTAVQRRLLAMGHQVHAVSRSGRGVSGAQGIALDLLDGGWERLVHGMDGVLNLVGVLREDPSAGVTYQRVHVDGARRLAEAAASARVPRFVQLSSLGAAGSRPGRYLGSKRRAEAAVQAAWPPAVVVRSSMVFGPGAAFVEGLGRLARLPVVPVPGDGQTPFDPVAREDLAAVLAGVLADGLEDADPMAGRVLGVGGPRRVTLDDLIDWAGRTAGRREVVPKVHVPVALVHRVAALGDVWGGLPMNRAVLALLTTPSVTDDRRWHRWVPHPQPVGAEA